MNELTKNVFEWYREGANRRHESLSPRERTFDTPALLWSRFGEFVGRTLERLTTGGMLDTDSCVPGLIFAIDQRCSLNNRGRKVERYHVRLKNVLFEREGIDLTGANRKYHDGRDFGVIGYDIEYQPNEKEPRKQRLLSHQFCFDGGPGRRLGLVLDTNIRFTDSTLKMFIANVAEQYGSFPVKRWIMFAHFSVAEGSWVDSSKVRLIERVGKTWDKSIKLFVRKSEVIKPDGKKSKRQETVKMEFADTVHYGAGSLAGIAGSVGLQKLAPIPLEFKDAKWFKRECDAVYKQFEVFRDLKPLEFYRYGLRDAIITAGIPIILHSVFGVENAFQKRSARYAEEYIAGWLSRTFAGGRGEWQTILGQHKLVFPTKDKKKDRVFWEPDRLQQMILQQWYKGGRNEARKVGYFEGEIHYHDMKSAYPTAIAALRSDYNFSLVKVRTRNDGAVERVKQLMSRGPFQPHGIVAYIRFKETCRTPMAPISVHNGIIYPMETEGQVICWPEYWTAKKLGIIEEEYILAFYEFEELKTRGFPNHILSMLQKRDEAPAFYKSILNYQTGKFVQGRDRRKKIPYSKICCPALGAYITSATRAAAAEIANLNPYHAITTDGIVSPNANLIFGEINKRLAERLQEINWQWMKDEFTGDKAVIWKTRGYILSNSQVDPEGPAKKRFKQARMCLQGEEPVDILQQVKDGIGVRRSAKTFKDLDFGEIFHFIERETRVNPNYDFKYAIVKDSVKEAKVEIDGVVIENMPCFETRPLRNINEYYDLRAICERMMYHTLREEDKKGLSSKDLESLVLTGLLNDRRCRHMVWEFRKRLARWVDHQEVTAHHNSIAKWRTLPTFKIPGIFGKVEAFRPILEKEAQIIKDEKRRRQVLECVMHEMAADVETEKRDAVDVEDNDVDTDEGDESEE